MSGWRHDLFVNSGRTGLRGALIAWLAHPGFAVVTLYRLSHWAKQRGGIFGRMIAIAAWRRIMKGYGCYIAPDAIIGPGLRLPHPTGIVIGEGTVIGRDVTLYQHVTAGRVSDAIAAYPAIGDMVTIYAGATVVGGLTIGARAVVAAHAVVRSDVPADAVAVGAPARVKPGPS